MLERSAVTLAVKDAASQSALADVAAKSVTLEIARMLDTPFASAPPAWRLSETLRPGAETAVLSRGGRLDGAQFRYHAKAIKALWHAEDPGYWDYANKRGGRERRLRRIPPWLEGFDASRRLEPPPPSPRSRGRRRAGRPSLNGPAFATAAELGVEKPLMLETVRPRHYDVSWADGSPGVDADGGALAAPPLPETPPPATPPEPTRPESDDDEGDPDADGADAPAPAPAAPRRRASVVAVRGDVRYATELSRLAAAIPSAADRVLETFRTFTRHLQDAQDGDASSTASALMLAIRWRRRARQANERRESESAALGAAASRSAA
ncbi:zeta toxin [Aureococcus anophagefferens]|nr:zeta toxin [Aureococcus anophagefferens]